MRAIGSLYRMVRLQKEKLLLGTILLALVLVFPARTTAGVDVNVSIGLPPPIIFAAPPELIVLPETYVYVVPDIDADIFFYNGWWWRPWEGRWYRSRYYNSGWGYYQRVPYFYGGIPSGWRNDYRDHRWRGHQWNYQRIPHEQVQQNWRDWEKSRHWEKQQTWGVQGLKPRTGSQQPSRAVQPKAQGKPQMRETAKPQRERPLQAVEPETKAKPQVREAAKPQQARPQSGQVKPQHLRPQQREAGPQSRKAANPQHQEAGPQSPKGQPQHSKQQQGNADRGEGEKQDRR